MKDVIDFKSIFEGDQGNRLEKAIQTALLDPSDDERNEVRRVLKKYYGGRILRGFTGDNQIFVLYKDGTETYVCYVCDIPKQQRGKPITPFTL